MIKQLLSGMFLAFYVLSPAFAHDEFKSIPFEETGPFKHIDGSGPHRNSYNLLMHVRNQASATSASSSNGNAVISSDIGDVAVIVDDGSIIIQPRPANPFDLASDTQISFVPGVDEFTVSNQAGAALDPDIGADLGLGDDDTAEVSFPAGFPFLGMTHNSIFVNSDGNITFGAGDNASTPRDAARHIGGPPRVSPLLVDLDPTSGGGSVNADVRANSVVVTWNGVPQFAVADSNTFQAVLHDDGTIDFVYGAVGATFGVTGVAEGNDEQPFNEIDIGTDTGSFAAGAIFEEFNPAILTQQMDVIALAKKFYETHDDKYDFLVMFTDFVVDLQGAFAFLQPVKNETLGLGGVFGFGGVMDNSAAVGSAGELEAIVNMNRIGLYWPDSRKLVDPPIKKFRFSGGATLDGPPGANQISRRARRFGTLQGDFGFHGAFTLGLNSAMSLMAQEAGHRWLAFPLFIHPTKGIDFNFIFGVGENTDLLGRQLAHWSFFFDVRVPDSQFGGDPRASGMEGNTIADLGAEASAGFPVPCDANASESFFLTEPNELIDGYTELDQYFMGVREAGDVNPFWYVDEPRSVFSGNSLDSGNPQLGLNAFAAQDDIVFCGKRVILTVADIAAFGNAFGFAPNGPRIPAIGDEVDQDASGNPALDVKTMAFILLVENEPGKNNSAVRHVQTFLDTWESYANGPATGDRGRFDTSLSPAIH